jgi:hypothetical protein
MRINMKITVRLFGTLGAALPGYHPAAGLVLKMDEGATVGDLLRRLNLFNVGGETVLCEGRLLANENKLTPGSSLQIFQALHGG